MFPVNTVLKRKEPQGTKRKADPLDTVRVIGVSPVKKTTREEWSGANGEFSIITPVDEFGANEVVPDSVLRSEYTVDVLGAVQSHEVTLNPSERPSVTHRLTPEEQFQQAEREVQLAAAAPAEEPDA